MTRNAMLCVLQNLITTKKHNIDVNRTDDQSAKANEFGSGATKVKKSKKSHSKRDANGDESISPTNSRPKKYASLKATFFLRKSRSINNVSLRLRPSSSSSSSKQVACDESLEFPPCVSNAFDSKDQLLVGDNDCCASNSSGVVKRRSLHDFESIRSNHMIENSSKPDMRPNVADTPTIKTPKSKSNNMSPESATNGISPTKVIITTSTPPLDGDNNERIQDLLQLTASISENSSTYSSRESNTTPNRSSESASSDIKRKPFSRSRDKKFHRHFKQVAADEEVINYFSCAFVSDILLQGYMYITRNHVAFYSNVFGYVTKLLIPIESVTRISKKKTVKIFPNAIAVATGDDRHVFSSFLSRETAYQLMINVWQHALPSREIELLPTSAQLRPFVMADSSASTTASDMLLLSAVPSKATLQVVRQLTQSTDGHVDVDVSELEISENDSSSAISGNEGLLRLMKSQKNVHGGGDDDASHPSVYDRNNISSSCYSNPSDCDLSTHRVTNFELRRLQDDHANGVDGTAEGRLAYLNRRLFSGAQVLLTLSSMKFEIPRTIHIAYFGVLLAICLALSAAYLNYRIVEIQNSHLTFSLDDFQNILPVNIDLYARILNWQRNLQNERASHTQNVVLNSLKQVSKISDRLAALSNLIKANEEQHVDPTDCSTFDSCNVA